MILLRQLYKMADVYLRIEKTKGLTKHFLSLLLIFLCLLNSFTAVLSVAVEKAGTEFSLAMGTPNEQQEEKSDPEQKEAFSLYTGAVISFLAVPFTVKKKRFSTHSAVAEEINLSSPTPPPERV